MHRATSYLVGLIVSVVLAHLSHAQEKVEQESAATIRLDFPAEKSIGFFEIFEGPNPDLLALFSKESRLLSAVGSLTIPKREFYKPQGWQRLRFEFSWSTPNGLFLHSLQIRDRDLDEDALKLITRFNSLRALELNDCRISENAFRGASVIESLERLEVSTQDESEKQHVKSLAVWAASLPNLEYLYATPSLTAVNIQPFVGHPKLATLTLVIERDQHAVVFKLLKELPALSGLIVTVNKDVSPRALDRLSSFQGLESLTLVGAEVDGKLLKELSKCTKLRELRMIMIRPGKEFHAGLGTIQSLQSFLLSTDIWEDFQAERAFFQELPNTLIGLPEVRDLPSFRSLNEPLFDKILARGETVESLEINELAPGFDIKRLAELAGLGALKSLKLTSVPIDDHDLQILKPLKNLENLSLVHSKVTGTGFQHLVGLPKLVRLQIMVDRRDVVPELSAVADLPHLNRFQLFGFGFLPQDYFPIAKSKTIRYLALSQGQLDDSVIAELTQMPQLQDLSLMDTQLTDACMKDIASTKTLRSIGLWGDISAEGVKELMPLPNLVRLYVTSPKFDEQAVQELPTYFPAVSDIGFRGVK